MRTTNVKYWVTGILFTIDTEPPQRQSLSIDQVFPTKRGRLSAVAAGSMRHRPRAMVTEPDGPLHRLPVYPPNSATQRTASPSDIGRDCCRPAAVEGER